MRMKAKSNGALSNFTSLDNLWFNFSPHRKVLWGKCVGNNFPLFINLMPVPVSPLHPLHPLDLESEDVVWKDFADHYRFLHGQAQQNLLPGLVTQFNRSVWVHSESRTAKSGHWGDLRKSTFCTSQWPKKHFRVAESGFWGDFPQVLYWKVFSDFCFGDFT